MNIIVGGKLGDFLLSLSWVKKLCEYRECKANIYMVDIGWDFGIENTYKGLLPILSNQAYINSFEILTDYELNPIQRTYENSPIKIFNNKILEEGYIEAGKWLNSPLMYKTCWTEILANTFECKIEFNHKWIDWDVLNNDLLGKILIHRKFKEYRFLNHEFPYDQIICNYGKENVVFVSTSEEDYQNFPYKKEIDFFKINTISDWYTSINSCDFFITNFTSPVIMSQSLNKKRIIEMTDVIDSILWVGESNHYDTMYWYINNKLNNLI
jgi:hypothetical protein